MGCASSTAAMPQGTVIGDDDLEQHHQQQQSGTSSSVPLVSSTTASSTAQNIIATTNNGTTAVTQRQRRHQHQQQHHHQQQQQQQNENSRNVSSSNHNNTNVRQQSESAPVILDAVVTRAGTTRTTTINGSRTNAPVVVVPAGVAVPVDGSVVIPEVEYEMTTTTSRHDIATTNPNDPPHHPQHQYYNNNNNNNMNGLVVNDDMVENDQHHHNNIDDEWYQNGYSQYDYMTTDQMVDYCNTNHSNQQQFEQQQHSCYLEQHQQQQQQIASATIAAAASGLARTTTTTSHNDNASVATRSTVFTGQPLREPILTPNHPHFTCSTNGRNGWECLDLYEVGNEPEDVLGEGSFGRVVRAKHKFATDNNNNNSIHPRPSYAHYHNNNESKEDDEYQHSTHNHTSNGNNNNNNTNTESIDLSEKRRIMFGRSTATIDAAFVIPEEDDDENDEYGYYNPHQARTSSSSVRGNRSNHHHNNNDWKEYVAIKTTKPTKLDLHGNRKIRTYDDVENFCSEISMLVRLNAGFVHAKQSPCLFLYEFFINECTIDPVNGLPDIHLVTELLGQELDQWRKENTNLLERDVMTAAKSILIALEYMHSRSVVHRDIKLQNILFPYNSNNPKQLKIADFGLAKKLEGDQSVDNFCGSYGYIAPEIHQRKHYRFEVDMFSFGVLLFRLLSGERPFASQNEHVLRQHTIELRYNVNGNDWIPISNCAKDVIRRLLINRHERWTAKQCLNHEWFTTYFQQPTTAEIRNGGSVLCVDHYYNEDRHNNDEHQRSHSRAFVLDERQLQQQQLQQQHQQSSSSQFLMNDPNSSKNRFWIDGILQMPLGILQSMNVYNGLIVDVAIITGVDTGMICVEEYTPHHISPLPVYLGQRGTFTEMDCRFLFKQLVECIQCMHQNGLAHRNLHMENVCSDAWGKVSVKGFKYCQPIMDGKPLTGHFGYMYSWFAFKAPEVDTAFYHDQTVDIWSLGAILYMLLTGLPPFRGDGTDLIDAKRNGIVSFDIVQPSPMAQELVRSLLQVHPNERLSIEQILSHEWMIANDQYLDHYGLSISLSMVRDWQRTK